MNDSKKGPVSRKKSAGAGKKLSSSSPDNDAEKMYELWDELDRFSAAEADKALQHLCLKIKELLRADNVKWMAAVRVLHGVKAKQDPLFGWRLRANYDLIPDPPEYVRLIAPMYNRNNRLDPSFLIGLASRALAAGAGKFRVHRMRDGWISYREFSKSEHYKLHYTELGITDRIWLSFPLNAHTESIFLIDRSKTTAHFTKREATLAGNILRGIRSFHRRLFLSRGLMIGESALSPVFQRIVQKLLSGASEKEIALSLGQSLATTHKYIGTIYERFGVKGRTGLMSLWLGA